MTDANLIHRLSNCLQTILELEPELERLEIADNLLDEFGILKDFLAKLEKCRVREADVERIESATACFLSELGPPLIEVGVPSGTRLLH